MKKNIFPIHKSLAVAWLITVIILTAFLIIRLKDGISVESDLLQMLPASEHNPVVVDILKQFSEQASKQILVLVGHPDKDSAVQLARDYSTILRTCQELSEVKVELPDKEEIFARIYKPFRYHLLSKHHQEMLRKDSYAENFLSQNVEYIYGILGSFFARFLKDDPLLLYPRFLLDLPPLPPNSELFDNVLLISNSTHYYALIRVKMLNSPFNNTAQNIVVDTLELAKTQLQKSNPEAEVIAFGMVRFAQHAASRIRFELNLIGYGSMLGIITLMLVAFGSVRLLFIGLIPLLIGLVIASLTTDLLFGKIYLLTLAFGATLTGVCIDYTLRYFAEFRFNYQNFHPTLTIKKLFPCLVMAFTTSAAGYLVIGLCNFPGLQQMAVFSVVGIIGAFLTTTLWLPFLIGGKLLSPSRQITNFIKVWLVRLFAFSTSAPFKLLIVGCLLVSIYGIFQVELNDDIRLLQSPPQTLLDEAVSFNEIFSSFDLSKVIMVQGEDEEQLLLRLEKTTDVLKRLQADGKLTGHQSLTDFLLPKQRQQESWKALHQTFSSLPASLIKYLEQVGFYQETIDEMKIYLSQPPSNFLTLADFHDPEVKSLLSAFWPISSDHLTASLVMLTGVNDQKEIEHNIANIAGATFIDKVKSISELFARYRKQASLLVCLAFVCVYLLLILRYGLALGTRILCVALCTVTIALGFIGLIIGSINFFHILAAVLLLGLAIDYAVFFAEGGNSIVSTSVAVILCGLTTILSFGLLALSTTPVLSSFGLMMFIGIITAIFLAPLTATNNLISLDQ